jgi:predicted lipoprotein with Yx(FWY)xxD motif
MLSPNRITTRVLGLVAILLIAAACSSSGGASAPPATASVAPSSAPASTEASPAAASEVPSSEPSEAAGGAYELTVVKNATLGDFLAGEDGMTLYTFSPDATPNKSTCNGDCATTWPPFALDSGETATAGSGVSGTIASFARDDGSTQVSYNGKPLYYFANDKAAGDTNGEGAANGKWHVAKP